MPQRSNDFQRLIFLIKQQVAERAEVTESKFLTDIITDSKREVDICIEQTIGEHKVIISLECRDRGRKAHVGWVEEMKAKHERLPTNVLVLVSKKGFTAEAYEVAKRYGIETLSFQDVDAASVTQLLDNITSLWSKVFRMAPTSVVIGVTEAEGLPAEEVITMPNDIIAVPGSVKYRLICESLIQLGLCWSLLYLNRQRTAISFYLVVKS